MLTEERIKILQELWNEGYCVVVFNPEEIGDDVASDELQTFLIQKGWEYIAANSRVRN